MKNCFVIMLSNRRSISKVSSAVHRTQDIDFEEAVNDFFETNAGKSKHMSIGKVFELLEDMGVFPMTNPRMKDFRVFINKQGNKLSKQDFLIAASLGEGLITRVICGDMIITNFKELRKVIKTTYDICALENRGQVSQLTPFLAQQKPEVWEVSLYSISNREASFGKGHAKFTIQSCIRPLMYALAVELLGINEVLKHVGLCYYTGFSSDINALNRQGIPCNPIINCGGITLCSWLRNMGFKDKTKSEIFDYILVYLRDLAGGKHVNFSNTAYMSERDIQSKNKAMMYYLRMKNCLPEKTDIDTDLDFYYLTCSFEVTSESLSTMGATIANYGVNPVTGKQVLKLETCKYTMAMMSYCTPTYSWIRDVGLPAVKGASGSFLLILPGIFGIALYSPKVNIHHTSIRAENFCIALSQQYQLHPFDICNKFETGNELDKTVKVYKPCPANCSLFTAAAYESAVEISCLMNGDFKLCSVNLLGRTLLHEAAAAGNIQCVMFFMHSCPYMLEIRDVMGFSPLDDAKFFGHQEVVSYLEKWIVLKTGEIAGGERDETILTTK